MLASRFISARMTLVISFLLFSLMPINMSRITTAIEEQSAATQEISRNVPRPAKGTVQVSSDMTDVQRGASETGSSSSQVLLAAQSLSNDIGRLKTEVSNFLSDVRAA